MTKKMFYFFFPLSCLAVPRMHSMDSDSFRPPSFSSPLYSSPSPDTTKKGHFEEVKVVTPDLIKECLEKLEGIDRHNWYYLRKDIAEVLNTKPWLLYYRENKLPISIHYVPDEIFRLKKDLEEIKKSPQWRFSQLKKDFATVVSVIYTTIVCNEKTTNGLNYSRLRVEDVLRKKLEQERSYRE